MDALTPVPRKTRSSRPPRQQSGHLTTAALLAVVNGALAGIGGVYLARHSVLITLIAAASAVLLASLSLAAAR
jgi:hypothetical protein